MVTAVPHAALKHQTVMATVMAQFDPAAKNALPSAGSE